MALDEEHDRRIQGMLASLSALGGDWRAARLGFAGRCERWEVNPVGNVRPAASVAPWESPSLRLLAGSQPRIPWEPSLFLELNSGARHLLVDVLATRSVSPATQDTSEFNAKKNSTSAACASANVLRAVFAIADAKFPVTRATKSTTPNSSIREGCSLEAKAAAIAADYITATTYAKTTTERQRSTISPATGSTGVPAPSPTPATAPLSAPTAGPPALVSDSKPDLVPLIPRDQAPGPTPVSVTAPKLSPEPTSSTVASELKVSAASDTHPTSIETDAAATAASAAPASAVPALPAVPATPAVPAAPVAPAAPAAPAVPAAPVAPAAPAAPAVPAVPAVPSASTATVAPAVIESPEVSVLSVSPSPAAAPVEPASNVGLTASTKPAAPATLVVAALANTSTAALAPATSAAAAVPKDHTATELTKAGEVPEPSAVSSRKRSRPKSPQPDLSEDKPEPTITLDEVLTSLPDFESLVEHLRPAKDPHQVYIDLPRIRNVPLSNWLTKWVKRAPMEDPPSSPDQPAWSSVTTLLAVVSFTFDLRDNLSSTMRKSLLFCSDFGESVAELLDKTLRRALHQVAEDQRRFEQSNVGKKTKRQTPSTRLQDTLATCQDVMATIVSFLLWEREDPAMFVGARWRPSTTVGKTERISSYISTTISLLSCPCTKRNQRNFQNQLSEFLSFVLSPEAPGPDDGIISRAAYCQPNSLQLSLVLLRRIKDEPTLLKHHLASDQFAKHLAGQDADEVRSTCDVYLTAISRLVSRKTNSAALEQSNLNDLDLLIGAFGIAEIRHSMIHSSALRATSTSVMVEIFRLTNELIDDDERDVARQAESESDTEQDAQRRLERKQRSLMFYDIAGRVFGLGFGDDCNGEALLQSVVQDYYGGRRGVFRLVRIAHGIQDRVSPSQMFSLGLRRLNGLAEKIETKKAVAICDPDVVESSDSELENQSKDRKIQTKPDAALFRMPPPDEIVPSKVVEFDLMSVEFKEFVKSETAARKARESGHGSVTAPFVPIEKNVYLHGARKFLPKDQEDPPCTCLPVATKDRCVDKECFSRVSLTECSSGHCMTSAGCRNQRFQNMEYKKLKMFKASGKKGWGLKSQEDIKAGEFIIEYVGEVLDQAEYDRRRNAYQKEKNFYFMTLENGAYLDAARKGSICRFINHSCDPNSATQKWRVRGAPCVGVFAVRDISRGEEICFDYKLQDESRALKSVVCECGAACCRGYLTGTGNVERVEATIQGAEETEVSKDVAEVVSVEKGKERERKSRGITNKTIEESIERAFSVPVPKAVINGQKVEDKLIPESDRNGKSMRRGNRSPPRPEPKKIKPTAKRPATPPDESPSRDEGVSGELFAEDFDLPAMKIPRKQAKS